MENYVLDHAFDSYGSIGTGECVRMGQSTPSGIKNRVQRMNGAGVGTLYGGTVIPVGVSITGCSESAKQVLIRLIGIAKAKLAATSGTILQGRYVRPASLGKVRFMGGGTPVGTIRSVVGRCLYAEGGGSPNALISVIVEPKLHSGVA